MLENSDIKDNTEALSQNGSISYTY